jgi:hypothetical protein
MGCPEGVLWLSLGPHSESIHGFNLFIVLSSSIITLFLACPVNSSLEIDTKIKKKVCSMATDSG